jgi:hypothetical protein
MSTETETPGSGTTMAIRGEDPRFEEGICQGHRVDVTGAVRLFPEGISPPDVPLDGGELVFGLQIQVFFHAHRAHHLGTLGLHASQMG